MNTYEEQWEKPYNAATAMEEAARCLLCLDAPCSKMCPAGTDPAKFIRSIRFLNVEGAAETIRQNNPLGAVCARVCPTEKYCQLGCSRTGIDKPINIKGLQQFATDYEQACHLNFLEPGAPTNKSVAIVGSGPGGLAAAVLLRQQGHAVTIYEERDTPGGFLSHGIPEYRLSREVVEGEIQRVENLGAKIICGVHIGDAEGARDKTQEVISLKELLVQYDAVLVDVGFQQGFMLPLFEGCNNVRLAIDFLDEVRSQSGNVTIPDDVVVIGGGDVAMDVATTLKKLGVRRVTDVIYEASDEFVCSQEELCGAREAGVTLIDGYVPVALEDDRVVFEHRTTASRLEIEAKLVILAVGQRIQISDMDLPITCSGNESATPGPTTHDPRIFIVGDIMQGDKTVVYAVRKAKEAVAAMASVLGETQQDIKE